MFNIFRWRLVGPPAQRKSNRNFTPQADLKRCDFKRRRRHLWKKMKGRCLFRCLPVLVEGYISWLHLDVKLLWTSWDEASGESVAGFHSREGHQKGQNCCRLRCESWLDQVQRRDHPSSMRSADRRPLQTSPACKIARTHAFHDLSDARAPNISWSLSDGHFETFEMYRNKSINK